MRVVFITQNDPFYLSKNLDYLLSHIPNEIEIVGTVLFKAGVGKKKSFFETLKDTYNRFGFKFFIHYAFLFLKNKINNHNVKEILGKYKIPIIELNKNINHKESIDLICSYQPDLLVSILGNQIFKKDLINLAPLGCLNLHTAKLPKYRGIMPTFWVLKNDEKETAVSVFYVDEGIDSGDILVQNVISIDSNMSQQELIKLTKQKGMDAIIEALVKIRDGRINLIPNDDSKMTYYSMPTRADVKEFYKKGKKFF